VAETYLIRPGIIVTASYDSTGQVTELVIAPQLTDLIKSKNRGLGRETLNEVIDELIPTSERGRGLFGGFFNIGCMPKVQLHAFGDGAAEQLIAPERGTARFSNLFVRSQLGWRSPAPGEFDRWAELLDSHCV